MCHYDFCYVQAVCIGYQYLCISGSEVHYHCNCGIAAVTVMAVFITGILGAVIATTVFKIFHIEDPVAQGLALGTASHAIGTSKALELGEIQAAMSSLAIAVTGILTVIVGPIVAGFY